MRTASPSALSHRSQLYDVDAREEDSPATLEAKRKSEEEERKAAEGSPKAGGLSNLTTPGARPSADPLASEASESSRFSAAPAEPVSTGSKKVGSGTPPSPPRVPTAFGDHHTRAL